MVVVAFEYDESTRKWDTLVSGAANAEEARHAFNAVVFTCSDLNPALFDHHKVEQIADRFRIIPAV